MRGTSDARLKPQYRDRAQHAGAGAAAMTHGAVHCIRNVSARHETRLALLVYFVSDSADGLWVFESVIDRASEVFSAGDCGTLIIARWWARTKGLVEDRESSESFRAQVPIIDLPNAKRVYRQLAIRHHPDHDRQHGAVTMCALNELWQAVQGDLKVRT